MHISCEWAFPNILKSLYFYVTTQGVIAIFIWCLSFCYFEQSFICANAFHNEIFVLSAAAAARHIFNFNSLYVCYIIKIWFALAQQHSFSKYSMRVHTNTIKCWGFISSFALNINVKSPTKIVRSIYSPTKIQHKITFRAIAMVRATETLFMLR